MTLRIQEQVWITDTSVETFRYEGQIVRLALLLIVFLGFIVQADQKGLSDWVNQVARRLLEAVSIDDWFNGQWPDSTVCNSLG